MRRYIIHPRGYPFGEIYVQDLQRALWDVVKIVEIGVKSESGIICGGRTG